MPTFIAPRLSDLIASAEREIEYRERVYARLVADRRMSQEKADHEIACMRALANLARLVRQARLSGLLAPEMIRHLPPP